jgi:hypothetical protein
MHDSLKAYEKYRCRTVANALSRLLFDFEVSRLGKECSPYLVEGRTHVESVDKNE